jgi:hypothetical protein
VNGLRSELARDPRGQSRHEDAEREEGVSPEHQSGVSTRFDVTDRSVHRNIENP